MSRIEKVMTEISELRSFYIQVKNRKKSRPPQIGTPSSASRLKSPAVPLQRENR